MPRRAARRSLAIVLAAALTVPILPGSAAADPAPVDYVSTWVAGTAPDHELGTSVSIYDGVFVTGAPMARDEKGYVNVYGPTDFGPVSHLQQLQNPVPEVGDRFGFSVSIYRDTIAIGAPYDDHTETNEGGVFVFERIGESDWIHVATLRDPNHWAHGLLGHSVAVYENLIVAGAPQAGGFEGRASVFRRDIITDEWEWLGMLWDPEGESGDQFGWSVDVYGATIVVGAPSDDGAGTRRGAVHVYLPDMGGGYTYETALFDADAADHDTFGWSVAIDAGTIAAGTPLLGPARGQVKLFRRNVSTNDWGVFRTLSDAMGVTGDRFGQTVALEGDALVVGATGDDGAGDGAGAAHSFYWTGHTWLHVEELTNWSGPRFGSAVAVWQHQIVVGTPDYEFAGREYAGRADVYLPRGFCDGRPASHVGSTSADVITGSDDDDVIAGRGGGDLIAAGPGDDIVCAGPGDDIVAGGPGLDLLMGSTGDDWVAFASAPAGLEVDLHINASCCSEGRDTLFGFENVLGSNYDDTIRGDGGDNRLLGGAGRDTLIGLAGDDRLDGGSDRDTVWYKGAPSRVTVDLHDGTATGGFGADVLVSIENALGSGHNDVLRGTDIGNNLKGGAGNDTLVGRGGNDRLVGGTGTDSGNGGMGTDTCLVETPINCE